MQDAYKRAGFLSTRDEMMSTRQSERTMCGQCQGGVGRGLGTQPLPETQGLQGRPPGFVVKDTGFW